MSRNRPNVTIGSLPSNDLRGSSRDVVDNSVVVSGGVTSKQRAPKSAIAREVSNLTSSLFASVVGPALKGMLTDFVSSGLEMALWGGGSQPRRQIGRNTNYAHYNRQTTTLHRHQPLNSRRQPVTAPMEEELFFSTRQDAMAVLDRMFDRIEQYQWVSVADMYHAVGKTPDYTMERWGWEEISHHRIKSLQGGFILDLPDPIHV